MLFSELMESYLDESVKSDVMQLLELKINNPEIGEWKRFDRVNEYIERGISEIEEKINSMPSTQVKGWDELNNLFLSFID